MKHHLLACSAAFILAPWLSQASAQEVPKTDFDYDALIEELPIESDAYGPPLTFDMRAALALHADGIARGVELCLAHGSSAWLVLALVGIKFG
mgnify:CR=1 FL=1